MAACAREEADVAAGVTQCAIAITRKRANRARENSMFSVCLVLIFKAPGSSPFTGLPSARQEGGTSRRKVL